MCAAIGYNVEDLHRTSFAGISLRGLSAGNWLELSEDEMRVIQKAIMNEELNRGEKGLGEVG